MDTSLIGLFCIVDDFCQVFLPHWQASFAASHGVLSTG
ncbi:hypothetical protein Psal006b_01891 [Piscirickettsia salmonis]|uniref:Transposase n=1 Tax=Piscirickettsia salmonis TaxID=1238 RepID=A0AAC8VH71_PISSA|nr:hypothetical protein KU39_1322 [Piscirickettsia salmonis]QGN98892.1 hypothetical protein Psal006b_01891 [Piscirickettsia salmonis]QGO02520.1 hypothetical protein Psal008_01909 [Piscirickettsia salmonis]QGO13191.1 hypothetical protein Psal010b_01888 [Piscirickettsia salmonis]QGO20246.1 hypothetical protein Psal013_01905 [Piscirickettsia salmonis]